MPVLSTQAWRLSQQRLTEEEQIQLHKELETCIEVAGTIRNSVESYMTEKAIRHIEELDYPYRQEYEKLIIYRVFWLIIMKQNLKMPEN